MSRLKYINGIFTYKQLCEQFKLPTKSGKGRQLQIQKLHDKHLFTEEKISKTNTLYHFNDAELQKNKFNLKVVSGYIKYLVYRLLLDNKEDITDLSLYDIKKQLGVCNNNFYLALYDADNVLLLDGTAHIPKMAVQLNKFLTRQIKNALNYLQKCDVLLYTSTYQYGSSYSSKVQYLSDEMIKSYIDIMQQERKNQGITSDTIPKDKEYDFYNRCIDQLANLYHTDIQYITPVFHIVRVKEYSDKLCMGKIQEYNQLCLKAHRENSVKLIDRYIDTSGTMDNYTVRDKRVAKNMFGENPKRDFQKEIDKIQQT
jgi:hypothetical protein